MIITKFTNFINEADVAVDKDLQDRITQMEKIRQEVLKIKGAADQLKTVTKVEDIDTRMDALIKQYENEKDSLISSALSYYKMLAEQAKIVLKQKQFETDIPKLATQLEADLNDLVQKITDLRKTTA